MAVRGTDHTCYTVRDMAKSLAFYKDLLGFEIVHERSEVTTGYFRAIIGFPDGVVHAVLLNIPGSDHHLELFQYKHPIGVPQDLTPNNPGSSHIAYHVEDLNAMYQTMHDDMVALGCSFVCDPVYLDQGPNQGGWALYMYDPDGIPIELFQPPSR